MSHLVKLLFTGVLFFIYFMIFEAVLESFLPVGLSLEFIIGAAVVIVVSFVLSLFSSEKLMNLIEY